MRSTLLWFLAACTPKPSQDTPKSSQDTAPVVSCEVEVCNGIDDDCDGEIDEDPVDGGEVFLDADKDGYGGTVFRGVFCDLLPGSAWGSTDCDDDDPDTHPGVQERCNSRDDDCDGEVDEDIVTTCFEDDDDDGWGVSPVSVSSCGCPDGTSASNGDCDDTDPTVHPDQDEVCSNGVDDDCDGVSLDCDFHGELRDVSHAVVATLLLPDAWGDAAWSLGDPDGSGTDDVIVATSLGAFVLTGPFAGDVDVMAAPTVLRDLVSTPPAILGDVDGDGFDDVAVDRLGTYGGDVRVLRGPLAGVMTSSDAWTVLSGPSGDCYFGRSVISGDVDGDDLPDLLVGTGQWVDGPSSAWLVRDLPKGEVEVEDVGFRVENRADAAGDLNGDGVDDLASVDARCVDVSYGPILDAGPADEETSCVAFERSVLPQTVSLDGDVDGDGQIDLLVGLTDPFDEDHPGAILLIPRLAAHDSLEDDAVSILEGEADDDMAWTARAVDLGPDDHDALAVTAPGADHEVEASGAVYLLYDVPPGTTSLSDADVKIVGTEEGARVGTTLDLADTRGMGIDDLLVGATGAVYVVVP